MEKITLNVIIFLHTILISFIGIAPFINSNYILLLHCIIIPFILLHWITNNNQCLLTIIERSLKKKINGDNYNKNDCITCRIIEPVFDFRKNYKEYTNIGVSNLLIVILSTN